MQNYSECILDYFGDDTVNRAVATFFAVNGVNEEVRDHLMYLETERQDLFLELVCDFIDGKTSRL